MSQFMHPVQMAKQAYASGKYAQALKLNPRLAGMHLNAALIYEAMSLNKQLKRHEMEAIRLAPRETVVLYQAAILCRESDDYSQALRILDRCLHLKPGFAHAWHLKGSALIDLGNTQAAQAVVGYWREGIQGAPDALDQHVDFYYTTEKMDEDSMGVRFDLAELASDRNLKNQVFDAVDIHGD